MFIKVAYMVSGPGFTLFTQVVFIVQIHSGSSEAEEENDPDGCYAFRRKAGCQYYAVSALL